MLNRVVYRFFTLCFIASSLLDAIAMADLNLGHFDRAPWLAVQSLSILIAGLIIPLYLLWRNLSTLARGRSILPDLRSSGGRWSMEMAMIFVWLGSLLAAAWLLSTVFLAMGIDSPLMERLGAAYLTGTLKLIAVPVIFCVELLVARHDR